MHETGFMIQALVYFAAAVILVPIFAKLKLGAVLGYLVAGVLIGPWGFKLISDPHAVENVSELGVVLLLFLVGLELNPKRLWSLRRAIFGLGGLQVLLTSVVVAGVGLLLLPWRPALAVGMAACLSSTAIAIQVLEERNLMATQGGQSSFAVSLFQDLAVIPLLLILSLLAPSGGSTPVFTWMNLLEAVALIAGMVLVGRLVLRPVFRLIASLEMREIFIAFALVLIVGSAMMTQAIGLSLGLGSFVAGILLAESEYRMELEVDIEPFKGLLLGLFFIAVGMGIDIGLLIKSPWLVLALAFSLVAIKTGVLLGLARIFNLCANDAWVFALSLSQVGEFAFVMSNQAAKSQLMSAEQAALLNGVVALSMLFTPLLFLAYERFLVPRYNSKQVRPADAIEEQNAVIIAGMGRFGQITARMLQARRIPITLIDIDPAHVEAMRKFGWRTYYGDASRPDVLEAAGVKKARLIVLAMDDPEAVQDTAEHLLRLYPGIKILARARSRSETVRLRKMGVTSIRETYGSALIAAQEALVMLGEGPYAARKAAFQFRDHDEQLLREQVEMELEQDEDKLIALSKKARQDFANLVAREQGKSASQAWHPDRKEQ
jgi:glutathione-regulated potassium-efflux system ancillary protein KefC